MDVVVWLLDSDPALRWQVLRDLTDADAATVAAERARVATEGWGAQLLALQDADGRWDGGTYRPGWAQEDRPFFDAWTATHFSLQQLVDFGIDAEAPEVREAVARVRENVRWEHDDEPYFDGEVEPCINGVALVVTAYLGEDGTRIADTLASTRLPDGAWNCYAEYGARVSSFHSTICSVEGLAAWDRTGRATDEHREALRTGEEYLLERSVFRRRSTGAVADPRMTMLSYPVRWFHDVLRGLDHFRERDLRDPRLADAVELLRSKADADGRWALENVHEGPTLLDFDEREGWPSRWVTWRALRVLRWWDGERA
ncbi:hypothetical protein P5G50_06915 [Leifsonia sp. F6_8S_P_1B]|uniref:Squalene cyclase n=1 Tax=Leifsonia williamsii TaxID=3035919 RepID=A0ABT8KAV1_9MICO|nr:hypothetical protein [Leifsonia williamsii]MDN4614182.1 hypothetical protein [Leifsonia williamsii]